MTEQAQDQKGPEVAVQKAPKRTTSKAAAAKEAAGKKAAKPTLSDTAKKRLEQLTSEIAKLEELKSGSRSSPC